MRIEPRKFAQAFENVEFDEDKHFTGFDDDGLKWLYSLNLPKNLLSFLQSFCYRETVNFNGARYDDVDGHVFNNTAKANSPIIRDGFFILGRGMNGDPIAVDITDNAGCVGYMPHEEIWENKNAKARRLFIPLAGSIGSFFLNASRVSNWPIDSFSARSFLTKKTQSAGKRAK